MGMTPEELAAIRERADKATPGPWRRIRSRALTDRRPLYGVHGTDCVIYHAVPAPEDLPETAARMDRDADFIGNARTDIPRLLDYIDELKSQLKSAGEAIAIQRHLYRSGGLD